MWAAINDFCSIQAWRPGIAKCAGEGGNAPGATRTVALKSNGKMPGEGLDEYDDATKTFGYRLAKEDVEAMPVSFVVDAQAPAVRSMVVTGRHGDLWPIDRLLGPKGGRDRSLVALRDPRQTRAGRHRHDAH